MRTYYAPVAWSSFWGPVLHVFPACSDERGPFLEVVWPAELDVPANWRCSKCSWEYYDDPESF